VDTKWTPILATKTKFSRQFSPYALTHLLGYN